MRALAPLFFAGLVLASCKSSSPAPSGGAPRTDPDGVHVEGTAFRDGRGRQLLFRGMNAKVAGVFDVSFTDGRAPNYTFASFDEAAATRFEELGMNALRLPMSWSALEPQPLAYSETFFQELASVLDMARRHHFYVVLDMHQDAYSKEIGEDGAPLWAIVPPPAKLLGGPSDDSRRLTQPVLDAGFNFFANATATDGRPLEDAFVAAVRAIATRVAGDPAVLGFEAFNEPVVLQPDELDSFHALFADGVHAIDRDAPVLFEPVATRNQTDQARIPEAPWDHGPGVYAPHVYTGQFSIPSQNGWESEDPAKLAPSMQAAGAEAAAWGTPLFVGELGCDQSIARGPKWLAAELDVQDAQLASSTAWVWADAGAGTWGLVDPSGAERPATAKALSRSFPRAIAGDLLAIERPAPGRLHVRYRATARTRGLAHEVSVSTAFVASYAVTCDGAPVTATPAPGRATFVCPDGGDGEHAFDVDGVLAP